MALTTYTPDDIGDNIVTALGNIDSGTVKNVDRNPPARDQVELLEAVPSDDLTQLYVFEPEGGVQDGVSSGITGASEVGQFTTDIRWAVAGIAALDPDTDDPAKDVFRPIYEAVYDELLDDRTRGGNAFGTYPESYAHSSNIFDDRLVFVITFVTPFQWGHS